RFAGAAAPEGILGVILFGGWLAPTLAGRRMHAVALGAATLALLGTIYGLSVTLGSARTGDVVYHFTLLAMLLAATALLAVPRRAPLRHDHRRAASRSDRHHVSTVTVYKPGPRGSIGRPTISRKSRMTSAGSIPPALSSSARTRSACSSAAIQAAGDVRRQALSIFSGSSQPATSMRPYL